MDRCARRLTTGHSSGSLSRSIVDHFAAFHRSAFADLKEGGLGGSKAICFSLESKTQQSRNGRIPSQDKNYSMFPIARWSWAAIWSKKSYGRAFPRQEE